MARQQPGVYLLHGEDEFAIEHKIAGLIAGLGDAAMAELNARRLDGRTHSLNELVNETSVMPFLANRRLVILTNPLEYGRTQQKRFTEILDKTPPSTALVLVVDHLLTPRRDREKNRIHWLERWALAASERVEMTAFPLPENLIRWIQERAKESGGQFSYEAADTLARQVGAEPRILDQEVQKLLAYVNLARPVEAEDVLHLTPATARLPDFALLNALRDRKGRDAMRVLRRELEEKDPLSVFFGIVQQFRELLQAREVLDERGGEADVARLLNIHPYRAKLVVEQTRPLTMTYLEASYRRLLELDEAIKTGQMESGTALDMLVAELTTTE